MVGSRSRTALCPAQDARPFQQALHVASWLEMPCDRMLAVFGCFWGHNFSAMAHPMEFMYLQSGNGTESSTVPEQISDHDIGPRRIDHRTARAYQRTVAVFNGGRWCAETRASTASCCGPMSGVRTPDQIFFVARRNMAKLRMKASRAPAVIHTAIEKPEELAKV